MNYELVLPSGFIPMDQEEMSYVDGGGEWVVQVDIRISLAGILLKYGTSLALWKTLTSILLLTPAAPFAPFIALGVSALIGLAIEQLFQHSSYIGPAFNFSERYVIASGWFVPYLTNHVNILM